MKNFNLNELAYLKPKEVYYVYSTGKLMEGRPTKVTFTKSFYADTNGKSMPMYDIVTEFESNGNHFSVHGFDQVYNTKHDFEKGVPTNDPIHITFNTENSGERLCWRLLGYKFKNLKYWVYNAINEDDQFVQKELPMDNFWYDYKTGQWSCNNFPTCDFFPTRNSAVSWNTYNMTFVDGTQKRVVGENALLVLDKDQQKLVEKFIDIMEELKEHDIAIQTDICDNIYAYNTRNVECLKTSYDDLSYDGYEVSDGWNERFKIGNIREYSDDNNVWIKRKE